MLECFVLVIGLLNETHELSDRDLYKFRVCSPRKIVKEVFSYGTCIARFREKKIL